MLIDPIQRGADLKAEVIQALEEVRPSLQIDGGDVEFIGIEVDKRLNEKAVGKQMEISTSDSRVKIFSIPTNEELVIARDTKRIVTNMKN